MVEWRSFLNRKIIWLHHILMIVIFLMMTKTYYKEIQTYRLEHPSNQIISDKMVWVEGEIISFDYKNRRFDFKSIQGQTYLIEKVEEAEFISLISGDYEGELLIDMSEYQWGSQKIQGIFDYDKYLFSENYSGKYRFEDFLPTSKGKFVLKLRTLLYLKVSNLEDQALKSFILALFLDDDTLMDQSERFQLLGIYHLFAISGLHFGLIYLWAKRLTFFGFKSMKAVVTILFLILFFYLIDGGISSMRALIMCLYIIMANWLKRPLDTYVLVCVSNLLILCFKPTYILSQSYLLSFYAYISVAIILPQIHRSLNRYVFFRYRLIKVIVSSMVLQGLLLPVSMFVFGYINLFGFIANLIMIPIFSMLVPFLILQVMSLMFFNNFILLNLSNALIQVILSLVDLLPLRVDRTFHINQTELMVIILLGMVLSLMLSFRRFRDFTQRHQKKLVILTLCSLLLINFPRVDHLKMTVLDVGHGDSTLITYKGRHILIDTGSAYSHIEDFLIKNGVRNIDALILTHAHQDHIGGLENLINNVEVDQIYCMEDVSKWIEINLRLSISPIVSPVKVMIEDLEINLKPIITTNNRLNVQSDPNDNAILTHLSMGSFDAVFTADISSDIIESAYYLPSDIDFLKIPHHGSNTGLLNEFWEAHSVDTGVISHNRMYHFPSQDVVKSYIEQKVLIQDTFLQGTIEYEITRDEMIITDYFNSVTRIEYDGS